MRIFGSSCELWPTLVIITLLLLYRKSLGGVVEGNNLHFVPLIINQLPIPETRLYSVLRNYL